MIDRIGEMRKTRSESELSAIQFAFRACSLAMHPEPLQTLACINNTHHNHEHWFIVHWMLILFTSSFVNWLRSNQSIMAGLNPPPTDKRIEDIRIASLLACPAFYRIRNDRVQQSSASTSSSSAAARKWDWERTASDEDRRFWRGTIIDYLCRISHVSVRIQRGSLTVAMLSTERRYR